jgi:hypothetical protein
VVPSRDQPKLSPQTEVWPPALIADTPTTISSGGYVLFVSCLFLHLFYLFSATSHLFFLQLNNYGPITGSAETQPTDWSLASCPNCRHANDNRHRAVCFCGEFFISSPFLPLFLATSQFFLQWSSCGPITRSAEAQPTDWSLASRPHRRHANDNRQRRVCFVCELFVPSPFLPVSSYVSVIFFTIK